MSPPYHPSCDHGNSSHADFLELGEGGCKHMTALVSWFQSSLASLRKEDGQALVEYGLIIAIISVALVIVLGLVTGGLNGTFTSIVDALTP